MESIHIQQVFGLTPADLDVEIVERKGLGHPDTICDLVMEEISRVLSQRYLQHYGRILHHNCDKGLLVAGQVERRLGGGRVVEPMRLVIGDRATLVEAFDVTEVAVEAARSWFSRCLPMVDPDRHLTYQVELKGGSEELTGIFSSGVGLLPANDTSAAVGYAPLSETERLVLATEQYLNGPQFKKRFPDSGWDVKVMGVRQFDVLNLTVAMPLVDEFILDEATYFRRKEEMREELSAYISPQTETVREVKFALNTLDRPGAGKAGMYLSVLGTSAEDADSGEVGRGNQVNGVIALNRPRGSEAAAGKNPVSHVGKIYNVLTHYLAEKLCEEVPGVAHAVVWLCSRIGEPIDQPQIAAVQIKLAPKVEYGDAEAAISKLLQRELGRMGEFCLELAKGRYSIC